MERPQDVLKHSFTQEVADLLLNNYQPLRNIPLPISSNNIYLASKNILKLISMFRENGFRVGRRDNTQIYKFIFPQEDGIPSTNEPIIIDFDNTYAITALAESLIPVVLFITRSGNTFVFQKQNLDVFDFEVKRITIIGDEQ